MPDTPTAPVFVIGTMRSGSTLLRLMLDAHPNLAIGMETSFMRGVQAVAEPPDSQYGREWYLRYGLDRDQLLGRLAVFYDDIIGGHARAEGKQRWGEKTPGHLWHIEDLRTMYPAARFVAIVRHGGAVASSMNRWLRSYPDHVNRWVNENAEILRMAAELGEQMLVVRYEDLVADPRGVLGRVLDHIGEPWSDDVVEFDRVHAERGEHEPVEGGAEPDRPLDPDRVWAWLDRSSPAWLDDLERIGGSLLRWFGYDPRSSTMEPLPGVVLDGNGVAARLVSHPLPTRKGRTREERDLALADELAVTRRELQRLRSRRSVKVAVAAANLRKVRSLEDLQAAWQLAAGDRNA